MTMDKNEFRTETARLLLLALLRRPDKAGQLYDSELPARAVRLTDRLMGALERNPTPLTADERERLVQLQAKINDVRGQK